MKRIAFLLQQFELQSPAQQLLDRFLIGHNQDGGFKRSGAQVAIAMAGARDNRLIQARIKDFRLETAENAEDALKDADLVVMSPGTKNFSAEPDAAERAERVISHLSKGKALYLDAAYLPSSAALKKVQRASDAGSVTLLVSRAASHFVALPVKPQFGGGDVRKALIVVQGIFPEAELDALYALSPYLGFPWVHETALRAQSLEKTALWNFAYSSGWRPMLEAAVSRSDNIKGDPDRDGRTQDVVGLHLLEKLSPDARGWLIQSGQGKEMAILVLNGALADFNFAVEAGGQIYSAQLYHPQSPMENHYDALAGWITARVDDRDKGDMQERLFMHAVLESMTSTR